MIISAISPLNAPLVTQFDHTFPISIPLAPWGPNIIDFAPVTVHVALATPLIESTLPYPVPYINEAS